MADELKPGEELKEPLDDGTPEPPKPEPTSKEPDGKGDPEPEPTPEELKAENARLKTEKAEAEKAASGRLADLQSERQRRHLAEDALTQKNAVAQAEDVDPLAEVSEDDDTPVTKGDLKRMSKAAQINQNRQRESETIAFRNATWAKSDAKAKEEHTAKIEGVGLDYATVAGRAQALLESKPHLKRAIIDSPDPAEDLYQLGLSHPDSRKAIRETGSKDVVRKIAGKETLPITAPSSSGAAKGGGGKRNLSERSMEDLLLDPTVTAEQLIEHERIRASGGK